MTARRTMTPPIARGNEGRCSLRREEMRLHIMDLIERHDLNYSWCRRPTEAWAVREFEEIKIAPIRSEISYGTALHEIGHIKGRHQRSRDSMVRERWAWHWAKENALVWTPLMEQNRRCSLAFAACAALEKAGVEFLDDGQGVRLKPKATRKPK
jgi:hypothetical protein